jgi:hypothetical protein
LELGAYEILPDSSGAPDTGPEVLVEFSGLQGQNTITLGANHAEMHSLHTKKHNLLLEKWSEKQQILSKCPNLA